MDKYCGLLTEPPGKWRLINYGSQQAILLQGDADLIRRNLNLLSSFGGGNLEGQASKDIDITVRHLAGGVAMIPIKLNRLKRCLSLYFYSSTYRTLLRGSGLLDDDVLDLTSLEDVIHNTAEDDADDFIANHMSDDIPFDIVVLENQPMEEYQVSFTDLGVTEGA